MNTNNVSGYMVTPDIMEEFYDHHLSALPPTAVLHHTLQHIINFTHPLPTYAQNYFPKSLPKMMYLHLFDPMYILSVRFACPTFQFISLSLSHV